MTMPQRETVSAARAVGYSGAKISGGSSEGCSFEDLLTRSGGRRRERRRKVMCKPTAIEVQDWRIRGSGRSTGRRSVNGIVRWVGESLSSIVRSLSEESSRYLFS